MQWDSYDTRGLGPGVSGYILRSNGNGVFPSWEPISTIIAASGGISLEDEGFPIGITNGTNVLNFAGGGVTIAVDPLNAKRFTINIPSVIVTQTSYAGANPITVTDVQTINIPSNSNAYGTRWVETFAPTTQGNNGDIWYQVT